MTTLDERKRAMLEAVFGAKTAARLIATAESATKELDEAVAFKTKASLLDARPMPTTWAELDANPGAADGDLLSQCRALFQNILASNISIREKVSQIQDAAKELQKRVARYEAGQKALRQNPAFEYVRDLLGEAPRAPAQADAVKAMSTSRDAAAPYVSDFLNGNVERH